ncbi:KOW domain-containing RNA-binding protein [Anaeromicrobium sediminis]|uniref:KOW domain-containing RNA-binding protein n=1 Tax=Anaeromicrobium sediminis TaxID=1478221 RepID=UPI001A9A56A6|nr:KOW domain-containing RNA-binding protein [Anaeromicrobium sediminis]
MNKIDELSVGQIVKSKAGRDKDRNFIVIKKVDCQYVLIADGDLRKVDNLKRKKVRHLLIYNLISEEVRKRVLNDDKITNLLLRKELEKLGLN